ncbi:MAG: D-tyrosyl-tRNA(Tyr) deacylase [Lachnospiraceae bacterium]|nr:D-tyrosyl-tRNA(Tyr) deacylase [Lachnospiraceae bacterium]
MRFVIQIAENASCEIKENETALPYTNGPIPKGYMVLIGIAPEDTREIADKMIQKMLGLRIFSDENGKTNLSLSQVDGGLLLVSQFTLYADCRKGNRPSFINAAKPDLAEELYNYIVEECKKKVPLVATGAFGADMRVSFTNVGPFTILLDSNEIVK